MAKPTLGSGQAFNAPPSEIRGRVGTETYDYLTMIHNILFSLTPNETGSLNNDNIIGDLTDTVITEHALLTSGKFDHHGTDSHDTLNQASASPNISSSSVSVDGGDADSTYSSNEVALINELKSDLNQLGADYNSLVSDYNDLKEKLRAAGLMAT